MTYCIDTSSILGAYVRDYPPDVFPALWERIDDLIAREVIRAPEEVLHELSRKDDGAYEWAKARPTLFIELDEDAQLAVTELLDTYPRLIAQLPGRNQADPFVIAVARLKGLTVITEEEGNGSEQRPKIPFVCERVGVRVVRFVDVLRELGWRF